MGYLVRVELPWAVFGFVVGADGRITQAAPIAGWMEGARSCAIGEGDWGR
jgi:hypothetical protein